MFVVIACGGVGVPLESCRGVSVTAACAGATCSQTVLLMPRVSHLLMRHVRSSPFPLQILHEEDIFIIDRATLGKDPNLDSGSELMFAPQKAWQLQYGFFPWRTGTHSLLLLCRDRSRVVLANSTKADPATTADLSGSAALPTAHSHGSPCPKAPQGVCPCWRLTCMLPFWSLGRS